MIGSYYGIANYTHAGFDGSVFIDTPLTSDSAGNVYFGFRVTGANPLNLRSGIARIAPDGSGLFTTASAAAGDNTIHQVPHNCAPALSNDGKTLYIGVRDDAGTGYLVALDSATLQLKSKARLKDPKSGSDALLLDDSTASPTVGPDNDVYYGVIENPFASSKGWLLHFNGDLSQSKIAGAFGWDDTVAIVNSGLVPAYKGQSSYLLMTKYNNYAGLGGDGVNKIAILDPNATQTDARTSATVMKEVLTIAGLTPDQDFRPGVPLAVREWCINSAAVDPFSKSIMANSEDGQIYRWDLTTNTFTQIIKLTNGVGEAYTPTLIGGDGTVYAINNAVLFGIGATPRLGIQDAAVLRTAANSPAVVFTVTVTNPDSQAITVSYSTQDGTALQNVDYKPTLGQLTIPPGTSSQTVSVPIIDSTVFKDPSTFYLNLSSPSNAIIQAGQGTATITTAQPPSIVQFTAAGYQAKESLPFATITISQSSATRPGVSVLFTASAGTAHNGQNFLAVSQVITFNSGELSKNVVVPLLDKGIVFNKKTIQLSLSNAQGGGVLGSQISAVLTIQDDDATDTNRFVAQVYRDLLSREADPFGLAAWSKYADGGATHSAVVAGIEASPEFRRKQINHLYYLYLGRPAEAFGMNAFLAYYDHPALGGSNPLEQIKITILASPEYYQRAGGQNILFLQVLYRDTLNRVIDVTGVANLTTALMQGASRASVVASVLESIEAASLQAATVYREILRREADESSYKSFVAYLFGGKDERWMVETLMGSDEYFNLARQ